MTEPLSLVAIIGSLREHSFNRAVFEAARSLLPDGVSLHEVSLSAVPFFNEDLEDGGGPAAVTELKEAVLSANGLIVFTPQYNGGIPAIAKNAIDWLSRPNGDSPLRHKPVAVVAATPGRHDAQKVRDQIATVLSGNTDAYFEESLGIASISRCLSEGQLVDPEVADRLTTWLAGFVAFARSRAPQSCSDSAL